MNMINSARSSLSWGQSTVYQISPIGQTDAITSSNKGYACGARELEKAPTHSTNLRPSPPRTRIRSERCRQRGPPTTRPIASPQKLAVTRLPIDCESPTRCSWGGDPSGRSRLRGDVENVGDDERDQNRSSLGLHRREFAAANRVVQRRSPDGTTEEGKEDSQASETGEEEWKVVRAYEDDEYRSDD